MTALLSPYPLKKAHTLQFDASAFCGIDITSVEMLWDVLKHPHVRSRDTLVLGGGSNLFFKGDYSGCVLRMCMRGMEIVKETKDHVWLKAAAGEHWHALVTHCVTHHYYGIENLALIPGTVGAAPVQNIGAYGVEISEAFESLDAIELKTGAQKTFSKEACQFGYRDSVFKSKCPGEFAIVSVTFKLSRHPVFNLKYQPLKNMFETTKPTIESVFQAVIETRQSKLPGVEVLPNAGSFFKNPVVEFEKAESLKGTYPDMPVFEGPNAQLKKIPAAWLIEQCGFKGKREEGVGVYESHALVLVHHGGGSGEALHRLSEKIREAVSLRFGIVLEREVQMIEGDE